jgi:serpin B
MPALARVAVAIALLVAARAAGSAAEDAPMSALPAAPAPEAMRSAQAMGAFACALQRRFAAQPGNLLVSPWSLSTALAMTAAGARGETQSEMRKTLAFGAKDDVDGAQAALALALQRDADAAKIEMRSANAIWGARDVAWDPGYQPLCRDRYQGGMSVLDFADEPAARGAINGWVAERTAKRITDLIGPGVLKSDTRLVLTNAVYLRAAWDEPFNERGTSDQPFAAPNGPVTAKLMHRWIHAPSVEKDGVRLVALPYAGKQFEFLVLLPSDPAPAALGDLEAKLDAERIAAWRAAATITHLDVYLPRFQVSTPVLHLANDLAALGMPSAFDSRRADFSGMAHEPLFIGAVEHKAFISVNEEGTEAAAATAVVMRAGGIPRQPPEFRCDRPFLYLLRHVPTGAILFAGRLADPTAKE